MKKILVFLVFMLFTLIVSAEDPQKQDVFYFFYSDSCPHCHHAMPFIDSLEKEYPDIKFKRLEVSNDEVNFALFNKKMEKLQIKNAGVPLFIFNDKYVVGFKEGKSEKKIKKLLKGRKTQKTESPKTESQKTKPEKSEKPKK